LQKDAIAKSFLLSSKEVMVRHKNIYKMVFRGVSKACVLAVPPWGV